MSVPVFNEAERIEQNVHALHAALRESGIAFRLAIVEDGSTDGTKEVVQALADRIPGLIARCEELRLGRGKALRNLWSSVPADIYCYVDSDLPAGPGAVVMLLNSILSGADVAVGSRYSRGATVKRPPLVYYSSRTYNKLVNLLFGDAVADHQCGLKAFTGESVRLLLPLVKDDSWFWDTEILLRALALGLKVEEVPVNWTEKRYRQTSVRRLIREAPYFIGRMIDLSSDFSSLGHSARGQNTLAVATVRK